MKKGFSLKRCFRDWSVVEWLLLAFFIGVLVLNVLVVFQTSLHVLDSDTSSELVLSKHLNETGRIVSEDWFYSTDLQVLNVHLIFAPLFSLFSVWRHVRFFGVLILQGMLLLSYWYLCKAAKLNRKAYLLGGGLMLLPLSVAYGRIVLYNVHYIMHTIVSYLLIAFFLSLLRDLEEKRSKLSFALHLLALQLLSLGSGTNGIRQACMTHLPMLLVLAIVLVKPSLKSDPKPAWFWLCGALLILSCVAFGIGYLINGELAKQYTFANYGGSRIQLKSMDIVKDTLFGFLHMFGYRRGVLLVSAAGILSLLGLVAGAIVGGHCCMVLVSKEWERPFAVRFLTLLFPCGIILYFLFLFIVSSVDWPTLYINMYFPLFFPMVGALLTSPMPEKRNQLGSPQKIMAGFVAVVLLLNALFNVLYFCNPKKYAQDYEGLGWWDIHTASELEPLRAHLVDNGYDVGYCSYWFGNILTEMSNGQLETVPIGLTKDEIYFYQWLTEKEQVDLVPQKPFVIIARDELPFFEASEIFPHCNLMVEQIDYLAYEVDDPMLIYNYLHSDQ